MNYCHPHPPSGRHHVVLARCGAVCLLLLLVLNVIAASAVSGQTVTDGAQAQKAPESTVPAPPQVTAAAVYAVDVSAGVDLYAANADEHRAPASLTKMVTGLVVVNHTVGELDAPVTSDQSDVVDPTEFSHMGLLPGDTLTVEQLLYGLMVPSGSDAAHALARYVGNILLDGKSGDPIAAFVQAMNDYVASIGLKNTHFVNPEGDDAPGQYTTAHDLARIAVMVLRSKTLSKIVQTPQIDITSQGLQHTYQLVNTNALLGQDGVDGIKTGTTDEAGACLVISTRIHGNRVIIVVLGSGDDPGDHAGDPATWPRFADALSVLSGLQHDYRWISPTAADEVSGLAPELAAWDVTLHASPALVIPAAASGQFSYQLRLGKAGKPNSEVGRVVFFVGSSEIAERPVYQSS